jgi:hypothetical protein
MRPSVIDCNMQETRLQPRNCKLVLIINEPLIVALRKQVNDMKLLAPPGMMKHRLGPSNR